MTTSADELARRLAALESRSGSKVPQLAYSTLEAGAIAVTDEYDALKGGVGIQFDGSVTTAEFNGPAPLTPTTPIVTGGPVSISVRWDGLWVDGDVVPSNFTRVEIHIQKDAEPVGDVANTIFGTFETPRGGEQSFTLEPGTYFVALVARNLSGARGPRSLAASGDAAAIVGGDTTQLEADIQAAKDQAAAAQQTANQASTDVAAVPGQIETARQQAITQASTDASTAYGPTKNLVSGWVAVGETTIDGGKIKTDSITALQIAADAVTANELQASAVIAGKLAAGAVIAGTIAADAVTTTTLAADAVVATKIAADAILARNIKAGEVVAGKLAAGAVIAGTIAANAVTAGTIAAGAVKAGTIEALAVTAAELATDSVIASKIKAGEVVAGKLAAGAVIAGTIAANAVTAGTIAAGAITADKLDATAIDGKTITGGTLRTAATGPRMSLRPGASSIGYGNGVMEFFSGNASESQPGEIYTIADGPNPNDNISLYLMAPAKSGYTQRGIVQLFSKDADTPSSVNLRAETILLEGTVSTRLTAGATSNTYLRIDGDGNMYGVISGASIFSVASDGLRAANIGVTADLSAGGVINGDTGFTSTQMRIQQADGATYTSVGTSLVYPTGGAALGFYGPPSGVVKITVGGYIKSNADNVPAQLGYEIRTGSVVGGGTVVTPYNFTRAAGNYNAYYLATERMSVISGLTPGAVYHVRHIMLPGAAGQVITGTSLMVEPSF